MYTKKRPCEATASVNQGEKFQQQLNVVTPGPKLQNSKTLGRQILLSKAPSLWVSNLAGCQTNTL